MMELDMNQCEVIEFEDLDSMNHYYERFDSICKRFKEVRGDKFSYDMDIDFDDMTLTIDLNFKKEEYNDNTEGDSITD